LLGDLPVLATDQHVHLGTPRQRIDDPVFADTSTLVFLVFLAPVT
jgi:hypothetical protein